jgi:uncharacterized protein (TIGR03790 family)
MLGFALCACGRLSAEGLTPDRLAVIYNSDDPSSGRIAQYYMRRRHIPPANVVGIAIPDRPVIARAELKQLRDLMLAKLPSSVQSLLLVWSLPYAVECMSITTAFAAGYQPEFCEPRCNLTKLNPLFDSSGWLPADTAGWLPAMLLPSQDEALARAVIDRGLEADGSHPLGTLYLVRTQDHARDVRSNEYPDAVAQIAGRVVVRDTAPPVLPTRDVIGYFTGAAQVTELPLLAFLPGAAADHVTSAGGILLASTQMSALEWLRQGATASYGSVSEPCNHLEKFPNPAVLFNHYLNGDTLLEAYWKSVLMPGQGIFIGEPLSKPFSREIRVTTP